VAIIEAKPLMERKALKINFGKIRTKVHIFKTSMITKVIIPKYRNLMEELKMRRFTLKDCLIQYMIAS
jgi:hypothetical protein